MGCFANKGQPLWKALLGDEKKEREKLEVKLESFVKDGTGVQRELAGIQSTLQLVVTRLDKMETKLEIMTYKGEQVMLNLHDQMISFRDPLKPSHLRVARGCVVYALPVRCRRQPSS